jgi:hypothetical protein
MARNSQFELESIMAIFRLGETHETERPVIEVEVNEQELLRPGSYVFELTVVDNDGLVSAPVQARAVITDPGPVAIIDAPEVVNFGEPFQLSAERSHDPAGGSIVRYIWTLVDVQR